LLGYFIKRINGSRYRLGLKVASYYCLTERDIV